MKNEPCVICDKPFTVFVTYTDISLGNDDIEKEYVAHYCGKCFHSSVNMLRYSKNVKVYTILDDGKDYDDIVNNLNKQKG